MSQILVNIFFGSTKFQPKNIVGVQTKILIQKNHVQKKFWPKKVLLKEFGVNKGILFPRKCWFKKNVESKMFSAKRLLS